MCSTISPASAPTSPTTIRRGSAAETLAAHGAWLKLSGWYRLDAQAPYTSLVPRIRRLAELFADRMVWGSDWPHTMFAPDAMPPYAETWEPVVDALGRRRPRHCEAAIR